MNTSACLTLYNEEKGVKRMLDYIAGHEETIQDIVIASDNCHDRTDSIVEEWMKQEHSFKTAFFKRPERLGRASAIRLCLENTINDVNIVLAGDVKPIGNCFKNIIAYFNDPGVGAVTGHPVIINGEKTIADCLSHMIWYSHDESRRTLSRKGIMYQLSGEVMAVRKSLLKGFEGYNGLVEDAMIGYLVRRQGFKVIFGENVEYYMLYPTSLKGYFTVRKRCCYGRIELARKTGMKDNAYYELKNSDYIVNVLKATRFSIRNIISLGLGVPIDVLCRVYYQFKYREVRNLLDRLWQPAKDTKW
jgi:cellulose synthase/poly-beta-1,6-N-acetylglucosamine synthase-like glycosyltransferase